MYEEMLKLTIQGADGHEMRMRRVDIKFGTIDEYDVSNAFGELSKWKRYDYREGRSGWAGPLPE